MNEAKEFIKQNIFDVHELQVLDYMLEAKNHLKDMIERLEWLERVKQNLIERMKDSHDISLDGEHSVARSVLIDAIDAAMQSAP